MSNELVGLASIITLGIAAQWLGWKLKFPAILLLLIFGIFAGPIAGILKPDALFGNLLFPLVSASVAIILFEGGLSLKFKELSGIGKLFRNLISVGIIITWVLSTAFSYIILDFGLKLSILLGAILVVTGPTVIIPLLRQIRPTGRVGSIVKWEGIVNDPIGAILAVLVFEALLPGHDATGAWFIFWGVFKSAFWGSLFGLAGAMTIILFLKYYLVPDFLQNPISLMIVMAVYTVSDIFQPESGLLAVTLMGIVLANQKSVSIHHILEFKENLRVILISSLFIILAARLPLNETIFNISGWIFVALLIFIVRPASVWLSSFGSTLTLKEKFFISGMAPRGIVAASVASVFAIKLTEAGFSEASALGPIIFQVIIGTVAVYGITTPFIARRLELSQPDPQGVMITGAHSWAQEIAQVLQDQGFKVSLIDTNWRNIADSKKRGLTAHYGNVLSENFLTDVSLSGIGYLIALTPNDEVNSLSAMHFENIFGRSNIFQLTPMTAIQARKQTDLPLHMRGRFLFDETATYHKLNEIFKLGGTIKVTGITDEFDYDDYKRRHGEGLLQLFIIDKSGKLRISSVGDAPEPSEGQAIVSLIESNDEEQVVEEE